MIDSIRKRFLLLIAPILLISFAIVFQTPTFSSVGAQDDPVVRKLSKKTWRDTPVSVTEVKVKKGKVEFSRTFSHDDDDWLKGFSLVLKNTSAKEVVYVQVSLTLFFREGNAPERTPYKTLVNYGFMDGSAPHVPPGESAVLLMTDERYAQLQSTLLTYNYPLRFRDVEVVIEGVLFSDGMFWQKGRNFYRDPISPEKWIRDKEFMKGGSTKT